MRRLKGIWNWRPGEGVKRVQVLAVKGLLVLLTFMLCCTLVSRAADSMTVPVVTVKSPARQAMLHTVTAQGKVEAADRVPVFAQSDVMVHSVLVAEGDAVEAGELLFTYDTGEISRQLSEKYLELEKLRAELSTMEENGRIGEEKDSRAVSRAEEDYQYTDERTAKAVRDAQDALRSARRALNNYGGYDGDDDIDPDFYYDADYEAMRSSYREAKQKYEEAVADREEALREARRKVDDSQEPASVDNQADLKELDIRMLQLSISSLQEAVASSGQVCAPATGVVSGLNVEVGKRTGADAAAYLTGEGGLRFVADLTEEQQKHVAKGDGASITFGADTKAVEGLSVAAITATAEAYRVELMLPEGTGELDQTGTLTVKQQTQQFNAILPLSALYSDGPDKYVLTVRETDTPLGSEQVVERVDVAVEDSNETSAAVSGAVDRNSVVVIACDKALADGDRVRIGDLK